MEPNGTWRRCGEVFRVKSGGCHKHPSVHGYNAGFKKALITKEFDPEDFKNKNLPQQTAVDPEQLVREHAQNIVAKADAKVDSKFPARGNDNAEVDQERAEQSSDELPHVKFNRLQLEADRTAAALRKEKKNADREAKAEEDKSRKKIVQASLNKQGKPKWWKANGKKNDENEKQNENSTLDDSEAFASSNLKNKKKRRAERLAQVLTLK